ncbi:hypothetical protein Vau01_014310 [Virgisporangium aurantiacum]|uniref:Endonuclease GajA/Old nuclease/RecF-like AAA domain-containing protein n=1 Tax=Virgisporangium aurantiacum TaxID=175570 RepID=A0A8J3Z2F2_9ACTN|nr:hypothetical protein Vau01_014310 [Virgisporangium aurantiacum]
MIAGHNNNGKSNILLSAEKWLPKIAKLAQDLEMSSLDRPILGDGVDVPEVRLGVALAGDNAQLLDSLVGILPNAPKPTDDVYAVLRQLVGSQALRRTDRAEDLVWFLFREVDGKLKRDGEQLTRLSEEFSGRDGLVSSLSSRLFRNTSDLTSNLVSVLDRWHSLIPNPEVVMVPPLRAISPSTGTPDPDKFDTSGLGLPGLLQALQAPTADRYRQDSARFLRINRFLKDVLEDDTAQILVPHNRGTVHVSLGDRVLPLENLGRGISQATILAVIATFYDGRLICIEEPEINLHPILLRRLTRYLATTNNQYLLSTHSAHMLDDPAVSVIRIGYSVGEGTVTEAALTPAQRARVSQHLGYRASDILQSNAVIWVEGPSDRIYINHWISQRAPELIEGIHYSIMFYGGRLIAHLTGSESDFYDYNVDDFVSLVRINRNMIIVIDSDKRVAEDDINSTKRRVVESFEESGAIAWVTAGREIENYIPCEIFNAAAKAVHKTVEPSAGDGQYEDRFVTVKKRPNKVGIAERVVETTGQPSGLFDLEEMIGRMVQYLRTANDLPIPAFS